MIYIIIFLLGHMNINSGYNTMGRPSSLPVNKQNYQRSTSNPDLTTPTTPEAEMAGFFSKNKFLCRIY